MFGVGGPPRARQGVDTGTPEASRLTRRAASIATYDRWSRFRAGAATNAYWENRRFLSRYLNVVRFSSLIRRHPYTRLMQTSPRPTASLARPCHGANLRNLPHASATCQNLSIIFSNRRPFCKKIVIRDKTFHKLQIHRLFESWPWIFHEILTSPSPWQNNRERKNGKRLIGIEFQVGIHYLRGKKR